MGLWVDRVWQADGTILLVGRQFAKKKVGETGTALTCNANRSSSPFEHPT